MAGLLYFFPDLNAPAITPAEVPPGCGLADVLDGASLECRKSTGPGDASGLLVAVGVPAGGRKARCQYEPAAQTWAARKDELGTVTHHVGFETASKPTPADLARPRLASGELEGHPVRLADGNEWTVPAVALNQWCTLPLIYGVDHTGELSFSVPSAFKAVSEEAKEWTDVFAKGSKYDPARFYRYVVSLIGLGYRVGSFEACGSVLGLVARGARPAIDIIGASIGWPGAVATQAAVGTEAEE